MVSGTIRRMSHLVALTQPQCLQPSSQVQHHFMQLPVVQPSE